MARGTPAQWLADRLEEQHGEVARAEAATPQIVEVERRKHGPVAVGAVAVECVTRASIEGLAEAPYDLSFVVNLPRESCWRGEAVDFAESRGLAFGGVGDLYSALNRPRVADYSRDEYDYFLRMMAQHTHVRGVERIDDRKYAVETADRRDVVVVLLNEYELAADRVRTARAWYGPFEAVLATNPNGHATSEAEQAAESIGARIYKLREFMGMLRGGS